MVVVYGEVSELCVDVFFLSKFFKLIVGVGYFICFWSLGGEIVLISDKVSCFVLIDG